MSVYATIKGISPAPCDDSFPRAVRAANDVSDDEIQDMLSAFNNNDSLPSGAVPNKPPIIFVPDYVVDVATHLSAVGEVSDVICGLWIRSSTLDMFILFHQTEIHV